MHGHREVNLLIENAPLHVVHELHEPESPLSNCSIQVTPPLTELRLPHDELHDHEQPPLALSRFHNASPKAPRRSTCLTKRPIYLHDYHCCLLDNSATNKGNSTRSLSTILSYDQLSPRPRAFALSISITFEPQFYHEVVKHTHWHKNWKLWNIIPLDLWFLCPREDPYRWEGILKNKYNIDGSLSLSLSV